MSAVPCVTRTLVADNLTPVRAYAALRQAASGHASFLLESVVGGERWARFSILGYRPAYELVLEDDGWQVLGDRSRVPELLATRDPLAALAPLFRREEPSASPAERFARAHVGYFGWEIVHGLAPVPSWPRSAGIARARLLGGATVVVFDNLTQTLTIAGASEAEVDRAAVDLSHAPELPRVALPDRTRVPADVEVSMDEAAYERVVERAREYIAAGDAFQIVPARKFRVPQRGRDPLDVYRAMRVINPSPYMYFLDLPAAGAQILGASPETLVRLEAGRMTVRPIAGTRPRGRTPAEDARQEADLLADPKERAEHVMLIDLGRNDVGRVARTGTVRLAQRMVIERYSHVMHLVSEVTGEVDPDVHGPLDVLRAAFPAGTLSGAPKVRAMQIIRELETEPRGIYGGAVGYLTAGGDVDLAIAIRTALCCEGTFTAAAGAGVVESSVPAHEAAETRNKARAVLASIEAASTR